MDTRKEKELDEIKNSIIKIHLAGMIAVTLIGLAVYGIFVAKGNAPHPALNNQELLNVMLVVGIFLEAWHLFRLVPLLKQYAELKHEIRLK